MRRLLLVILVCLLGTSFSGAEPTGFGSPETALQRAADHYRSGKLNEAAGLLRGYLVSQPDPNRHIPALFMLAKVHADLGEPVTSLDYIEQIPRAERGPAIRLLEGRMLIQTGQAARANQVLIALDPFDLTVAERQQRWQSLSDAALLADQPLQALYFLSQALGSEGAGDPASLQARVHELLDTRFDDDGLREVIFMYADTNLAFQAMLKLGWRALGQGDKEQALHWAKEALAAPLDFAYRKETLALQAQLNEPNQLRRVIGVLLPLTGKYATFGTLVQRGMQLAEQQFRPEIPVRLIYRDTAGDPHQAAQQLAEMAISDRIMAAVGPLVGAAAEGAMAQADSQRLPLLTLSQKEGLAAASPYVFRNSLTTRLQVRALLDAALDDLGLTTFAMLSPATRQGELFAEEFRAALQQRGGVLIAAESYSPEQTDFRRQVRLLLGLDPDAPDEEEQESEETAAGSDPDLQQEQEQEEPPPFEALFIPDYADRIALIAPQLVFYGLEKVQLLGTNGWNDPELLQTAGQFIEGAIFTDGFFRHSPYPFVQEFVQRYYATYGQDPTILEAQGYDAAGILLSLFNYPDVVTREDVRRGLTEIQNFPGVTGATRFDAVGEADKVLFLLQVQNGIIVQRN